MGKPEPAGDAGRMSSALTSALSTTLSDVRMPFTHPPASAEFALFDNQLEGRDLWLEGLVERLICRDEAEVASCLEQIEAASASGRWVALAVAYELGEVLEPRLRHGRRPPAPTSARDTPPLLTAWIFSTGTHLDRADSEARIDALVRALPEEERIAGIAGLSAGITRDHYLRAIDRIRALIHAGDCYQVNYTWPLQGDLYGSPLALYRRLMQVQPVAHGGFVTDAEVSILSRSPELFVERRGHRLTCRPMKGTAARDTDPDALRQSPKDRAENVMIVDLIRNDLGRLAPSGGVKVATLCEVEAYPTVWQMTSTVTAEPVSAGLHTILHALFPCGSVTGAPKIRAMEIIRELEASPRGLYCGAFGWIAPGGDFSLNVPIRTLRITPERRVCLNVGSGVVADSDGPSEWAECLLKARFVSHLPPQFGLIETLRCEAGQTTPYPLLARHLARLDESARALGHRSDIAAVEKQLLDRAGLLSAGTYRVRLELSADGCTRIDSEALAALAAGPHRMGISEERVTSTNPLLRHKTTLRTRYDRVLAQAMARGQFDALLLNENGELVEGARSNLFVDRGDGLLLTPPLAAGALNGVLRRELIELGRAIETRLYRADLEQADTIYLGNALRGLIAVELER